MIYGNYEVFPITIRTFVKTKETSPTGDEKKGSIPVTVHYLFLRHVRSGLTWKYVGTKRGGRLTFGDSRESATDFAGKKQRFTEAQLLRELTRLIGDTSAISAISAMFGNVQKPSDAKGDLDRWNGMISGSMPNPIMIKDNRALAAKFRR